MRHHLLHHECLPANTSAGQHLRLLRRQAGLSQLDLALMAEAPASMGLWPLGVDAEELL